MWEERKSLSRTESRISRIVCNVSITGILKFHENSLTLTTIVVQQRLIFLWRKDSASKFRLMSRVQSKQQHSPRTRSLAYPSYLSIVSASKLRQSGQESSVLPYQVKTTASSLNNVTETKESQSHWTLSNFR